MKTTVNNIESYSEKCYKVNGHFVPKSVVTVISETEIEVTDWFFNKNKKIFATAPAERTINLFNETLDRFDGEISKETEKALLIVLSSIGGTVEAWFPKSVIISIENNVVTYDGSFNAEWKKSRTELI